ncbi:NUDIX domain-containing protein [Amycolatopsis sp. NPDC051061]|uniref:NUDIX domain-containing protein n=1 Tax=Amycolatopsis sp. NPDC051061 TaxID=3155042 RepID=UPI00343C111E
MAVVIGPGGVGKTALAVKWANAHADRFPDGQLYVDLRGFSPDTTVTSADALGRFLRALRVPPEQVPATLAERVSMYRTITAGRQLLLVVLLDNAASAEQVRPLIPTSTGSVVVVTSRLRLPGLFVDGAQLVEVPPLEQADAVKLLAELVDERRVRDEPAAVAELARLCGRFPIALRVAAARLATRTRWSVSQVVVQLRNAAVTAGRAVALRQPGGVHDGTVRLVQPRRGRSCWRIPGGRGKPGESPSGTCGRELHEELGLRLTPGDLMVATFTVPLSPEQEGRGRVNFLFDCGVHRAAELSIKMQRAEVVATAWIPQAEAMRLLHPGDQQMVGLAGEGLHYGEYLGTSSAGTGPGPARSPATRKGGDFVDS